MSKYRQTDLGKVRMHPFGNRKSKVLVEDFASVFAAGGGFKEFIDSLPNILKGKDLRDVVEGVVSSRRGKKPVVWMIGAHIIKCGLNPILIDLMERGFISHLAMNGAGAIHDSEVALWGKTSEDVLENLENGSFGMSEDTGRFVNGAACKAMAEKLGYGESLGRELHQVEAENLNLSLLASGYRLSIPVTVHVALGTDIVHQQPTADGAAFGDSSYRDFKIFTASLENIEGGAVLNVGSAVIMPEVFLKALCVVRNLGHKAQDFMPVNFDMIDHYRTKVNVVDRPTARGFSIIGHHEIMIPLLAATVKCLWEEEQR